MAKLHLSDIVCQSTAMDTHDEEKITRFRIEIEKKFIGKINKFLVYADRGDPTVQVRIMDTFRRLIDAIDI